MVSAGPYPFWGWQNYLYLILFQIKSKSNKSGLFSPLHDHRTYTQETETLLCSLVPSCDSYMTILDFYAVVTLVSNNKWQNGILRAHKPFSQIPQYTHPHPQCTTPEQKCIHPCSKAAHCRIWDRCTTGPARVAHSSTQEQFQCNGSCHPSRQDLDHHPAPHILVSTNQSTTGLVASAGAQSPIKPQRLVHIAEH